MEIQAAEKGADARKCKKNEILISCLCLASFSLQNDSFECLSLTTVSYHLFFVVVTELSMGPAIILDRCGYAEPWKKALSCHLSCVMNHFFLPSFYLIKSN